MSESQNPTGPTNEPRIGRSVSLDDAASLLGVSRRTIYNRIREGRLQTVRTLGGSQRVLLVSMPEAGAQWRQPSTGAMSARELEARRRSSMQP
jgi:excisionase family DNA binding protein